MNLAILIGVDTYTLPGNNLPGCVNDIKIMSELLKNLNKFDDILILNKNESSKAVKDKILKFIIKHSVEGNSIDDFLFYFTGHGKFDENEFYYILSDYSENKIKQTSLENSELDTWIRKLSPKTTIKIVDACYSGAQYIKDINSVKTVLDKTKKQINDCYFMYSSKSNQTSMQTDLISFFTLSFVNAVLNSNVGELRYKEIMDYISDSFAKIDGQTPYFVTQGDFTNVFGSITDELKSKLQETYNSFSSNLEDNDNKNVHTNLIDLIKSDADNYCTKDEMLSNLDKIKNVIENYTIKNPEFKELYNIKPNFLSTHPHELNTVGLGTWLNKNDTFFAKPTYTEESYTEIVQVRRKNPLSSILGLGYDDREDKEVTKQREVISGFELTQDVPYESIEISCVPNYINLKSYSAFILFAFSKRDIVFFRYTSHYKELNWDKSELNLDNKWKISTLPAKDFNNIESFINDVMESLESNILDDLYSKYDIDKSTK